MTEETPELQTLARLTRELASIRNAMTNDAASFPSWFEYTGRKRYNKVWPVNELITKTP